MSGACFTSKSRSSHPLHVIKTLGEGTHGKVVLAVDTISGEQVAIKTIKKKLLKTEKEEKHVRQEIDITSKLCHPHIISVFEVFETESEVVLVLEYASGGELFDYINAYALNDTFDRDTALGGLSDADAKKIFRQLVSAVSYLHEKRIVHRDLKLENVLLDSENNAKLADFGLSAVFSHGQLLKTYCGSPLYASPEIVNGRPYQGPEVDCWSLGVLLYAMVYGIMPFDGRDFKTLRSQITLGLIQQPAILSSAHDLIVRILNPDELCRATLSDIACHPWLQNDMRDAHSSNINAYLSTSGRKLSPSSHLHNRTANHSYAPPTDSQRLLCHGNRLENNNSSLKQNGACYPDQDNCNSTMSRSYFPRHCGGPYTSHTSYETYEDESAVLNISTSWHSSPKCTDYRSDRPGAATDIHLMTSFIGTDVRTVNSTCDVTNSDCSARHRCDVEHLTFADSDPSSDCTPLKTFSADSLDRGDESRDVEAEYCSDSISDAEYKDYTASETCSRCYDFADIDAVLDGIADAEKAQIRYGSELSCDSLE